MSAHVEITGMDELTRRVHAWPQQIDAALAHEIEREVRPMVAHMRSRAGAVGGPARIASRSLGIAPTSNGMSVKAGSGGLAGLVLAGSEYGGRKRPKRSYATRSRSGNAYLVRRRTTRQFRYHLGNRGYWFWPTARADLKGINARVGAILARVVNG
jgi:hypothetical protein